MKKLVDNKISPSYHRHMTKIKFPLTREELYKIAQDALAERIEQLQNQRDASRKYREKKNVRKKR